LRNSATNKASQKEGGAKEVGKGAEGKEEKKVFTRDQVSKGGCPSVKPARWGPRKEKPKR